MEIENSTDFGFESTTTDIPISFLDETTVYNFIDIAIESNQNLISNASTLWGFETYFKDVEVSGIIMFTVNGIMLSAVSLFGIFGNLLSASVLSKKKMRSSLSTLLLGLSICDLTVCTLAFFWGGLPVVFWKFRTFEWYMKYVCSWHNYLFIIWMIGKFQILSIK
jgi:hypothetical protein